MTAESIAFEEPPPQPPRDPESDECCQSGCVPCVYDIYWEAYARYEAALLEWQTRQRELK